jgi:PhzF family phenazine biosynthesis protein
MKEVDLCGHATLATAKVIFQEVGVDSEVLAFDTKSGPLYAHRIGSAVRIDLPANPTTSAKAPKDLLEALGPAAGPPKNIEMTKGGLSMLLVELEDEARVRAVQPDFKAMRAVKAKPDVEGVIVTAKDGKGLERGDGTHVPDFVSRFFAPWVGIDEDPVCGAAHTALGPYWSKRLGHTQLRAHQLSVRGGELIVKVDGDRVHLTGEAVVVLAGTMRLD